MATDGTLINEQLVELRDNLVVAKNEKAKMATDLIDRGATDISTTSRIATIGEAACDLIDSLERGELTSAIRFRINPIGAGGFVPGSPAIASLLKGAHILLEEPGTTNVWRVPITSIEDAVYAFDNTFTKAVTTVVASVVLGLSSADVRSRRVSAVITQGATVDITITTYLADEDTFEIGRVFPIDAADVSSYLITATTANGVRTERFGKFDVNGTWLNETGIQAAVPSFDAETGEVATWSNGADGRADFENIWPWSEVKREIFTLTDTAGTKLNLDMAGFRQSAFYGIRFEERVMAFDYLQEDGSLTTSTKACRILWIARPHLPGYEIPSCFYRKKWTTNDAGSLAMEMELSNGLYIAAHKANAVSLRMPTPTGGSESVSTLNSGTIGSTNTGDTVAAFATRASHLNRLPVFDNTTGKTFEADATGCRFAAMNLDSYMAFWHLFIVQFGMDAQTVFYGVCEGSAAQTKAGTTDMVVQGGYMTGCVGPAASTSPFCFLGIENFGYGSEGDTLCDVSYFSGRDTDEEALYTRIYVQPDRSRYTPAVTSQDEITANGYIRLCDLNSTTTVTHLSGRGDIPAVRDMHMPCATDEGFLNAKKADGFHGLYKTGQGTGAWVLSCATLFGYRLSGFAGGGRGGVCALGWCSSWNAPSHADADIFGSRVTMLL